jgi:amino-acid N-acetyltransferase
VKNIRIQETKEYELLIKLFMDNDLEFSDEEPVPTDLIKCWKVMDDQSDRLAGGIALAMRQGEYIIDGIAVEEEYRKTNVGKALLNAAIQEVKNRGGSRIYLVARAPGFFRKSGFVQVDKDDAPNFFECLTCPQYGVNCFPEVMVLHIDRSEGPK